VKELDADFIAEKNSAENKPIFLYKLYAYNGVDDLYLAEYDQDVTFGGQVYTRFPMKHDFIDENSQGRLGTVNLTVANVNRIFQAYVEAYDLRGNQVDIIQVWSDTLADSDAFVIDTFHIDSYSSNEESISFALATKMDVMELQLPSRKYLRTHCSWRFKGTECAYAGGETECNRTFQRCKELLNQERFGGFPSVPFRNIYVA